MLDESYLGKQFSSFEFVVETAKIKELCLAVGDSNPIFFNSEEAGKEALPAIPVPLTFGNLMLFWGFPQIWDVLADIGLEQKKMVHAQESYEYLEPIYNGDALTCQIVVSSLISKPYLDSVTFTITFQKQERPALVAMMKLVDTKKRDDR